MSHRLQVLGRHVHASNSSSSTGGGGGKNKRDWHPEPFRTVVALGESTTAGGWSTSPDRCWVAQLGRLIGEFQELPAQVINSGIGANLISQDSPAYEQSGKPAADVRLDKHLIAHEPDLAILSYGLNDARGGTSIQQFVGVLRRLVHRIRAAALPPPLILLVGPYFMTAAGFEGYGETWGHADLQTFREYNAATRQLAASEDCLFVDVLAANGDTDWMVHHDGVHANDLGHRIVAHAIFQALAQNCSGLAHQTQKAEQSSPRWRDESVLVADFGFDKSNTRIGSSDSGVTSSAISDIDKQKSTNSAGAAAQPPPPPLPFPCPSMAVEERLWRGGKPAPSFQLPLLSPSARWDERSRDSEWPFHLTATRFNLTADASKVALLVIDMQAADMVVNDSKQRTSGLIPVRTSHAWRCHTIFLWSSVTR